LRHFIAAKHGHHSSESVLESGQHDASVKAQVVEAAALLTIAATAAFALVIALRGGLNGSAGPIFFILLCSLLPVWVTAFAAVVSRASIRPLLVSATMTLSLLFPILGLVAPGIGIAAAIILLCACAGVAVHARPWVGRSVFFIPIRSLPVCLLLIVSSAPARLFLPESMLLGVGHTEDSLFHMSIAQMIEHYGAPSVGADGLLWFHYHVASHAVAAGLAKATGASVPLVYAYWGALGLKIQLLWAVFLGTLLLSKPSSGALTVRALPRMLYAMIVLIVSDCLESESCVMGLSIFVGLVPLLCVLIEDERLSGTFRIGHVTALLTAIACAAAKISIGFMSATALCWIALRHRASKMVVALTLLCLALLAVVTLRFLTPTSVLMTSVSLRITIASYLQYLNWTTLLSYGLPILILGIDALRPGLSLTRARDGAALLANVSLSAALPRLNSFPAVLRSVSALSAPGQLLAVAFAACVLILVTVPIGSNMAYFSVVVLVLALMTLPTVLSQIPLAGIDARRINPVLAAATCLALAACAYQFALAGDKTLSGLYKAAWPEQTGSSAGRIVESWRVTRTPFGLLQQRIDELPWTLLMRDLEAKQALPGGVVAHVSPSAQELWHHLSAGAPYWCMAAHLMIPAQTGMVEIRSIEPQAIERECAPAGILLYGFGKDQDAHRTGQLASPLLCAAAAAVPARWVYVVASVTQLSNNELIDCQAP
jgi:hypothetical protein